MGLPDALGKRNIRLPSLVSNCSWIGPMWVRVIFDGEPWSVVGEIGVAIVAIELRHLNAVVLKKLVFTTCCQDQHFTFPWKTQQSLLYENVRHEIHIISNSLSVHSLWICWGAVKWKPVFAPTNLFFQPHNRSAFAAAEDCSSKQNAAILILSKCRLTFPPT